MILNRIALVFLIPRIGMTKHKTFEIKVLDRRKDGGRIIISTGGADRDRDRVFPQGCESGNYLNNPIVQWGHNYYDPWATVGRTKTLEITETGIVADFELRPAANDQDPQNITLLLWEGDWIRTASIGFQPKSAVPNDFGGMDFVSWELLEWSLVPVPANQDALRLAAKQYPVAFKAYQAEIEKRGARHSAKDQEHIQAVHDHAVELGADCTEPEPEEESDGKRFAARHRKAEALDASSARAWIRQMEVVNEFGTQHIFACFEQHDYTVPADATVLRCDDDGNIIEKPDPEAGQTIKRKSVVFRPAIACFYGGWDDEVYEIWGRGEDSELVKGFDDWEVIELSDVLLVLPVTKSTRRRKAPATLIPRLTRRGIERAKAALRRVPKAVTEDDDAAQLLARLNAIPLTRRI